MLHMYYKLYGLYGISYVLCYIPDRVDPWDAYASKNYWMNLLLVCFHPIPPLNVTYYKLYVIYGISNVLCYMGYVINLYITYN